MSKILVTGANGYIGRHVIEELKKQNVEYMATDCMVKEDKESSVIQLNLFDDKDIYEKTERPEILLHLAWQNGFIHNAKNHMLDLSRHFAFLSSMIDSGVKHICIMGSMHEVGYFEGAIDENSPTSPMSQYAIAKNALRQSMELYCKEKGVTFQWIRGFYIYGDNEEGNSIFSKLVLASKDGKKQFPFTTGKNKYDFISINNLARQIVAVINQKEINGIINCCSGKAISLSEQVEWFIKENHLHIELIYGAFPDRDYDSPEIYGNDIKIKKIMERQSCNMDYMR